MVNYDKSQPAPISLAIEKAKKSGTYRTAEVLERLQSDFKNKCYICEEHLPSTINVEHFVPHKGNRDLEFDWNNLFWVCGHCNNTKLAKPQFDNILNCTNSEHQVLEWIRYEIKPFPKEKVKLQALCSTIDNPKIIDNTIELLLEVYNGTTPLKTIESSNMRQKLVIVIQDFQKCLSEYYYEDLDADEKEFYFGKIKKHLKKASAFTAFKRWIVFENEDYRKDFEQFFD